MRLLLSLALCAVVVSSSALVAAAPHAQTRLRPQDDRLSSLLRDGTSRSATLKTLVDRIETSNVIVYVTLNPLMKSNLSGTLTWMARSGEFRYLRASIGPHLTPTQMLATIAHELQHAVEVIDDETVTDENGLVALYRRIGRQSGTSSPSRWETDAAQRTGFQVKKELLGVPAMTIARAGEDVR